MKRTILVLAAILAVGLAGTATAAKLITSRDIKNGTIKTADMSKSAKRALKGQRGPAGPAGPINVGGLVRVEQTATIPAGGIDHVTVGCPAGYGLISGGFAGITADGGIFYADSFGSKTSWSVGLDNYDSLIEGDVTAVAFCAPSGRAVIANAANVASKADALDRAQRASHK